MLLPTRNFDPAKDKMLPCPCCGDVVVDPRFLDLIQYLRDYMGIPFTITSGYRCKLYNTSIGGATFSQHPLGRGWDIDWKDWDGATKHKLIAEATRLRLSIIPYQNHFHIDRRLGNPIFDIGFYKK